MRYAFASAFCLVLAAISPVCAQQRIHVAQSGRPTILSVYFNCTAQHGLPSPSGTAQNGIITTRVATGNYCGNPRQPVVQMIYTSRPGFRGRDQAYYYTFGPPRITTIIVR